MTAQDDKLIDYLNNRIRILEEELQQKDEILNVYKDIKAKKE